jgi:predicted Zn-dependent protease
VTEVDLSATSLAYTLALPSPLTNIAVLSTKRLDPGFWGEGEDCSVAVKRLTALMLHSFGHLLNLSHEKVPGNAMTRMGTVQDLGRGLHRLHGAGRAVRQDRAGGGAGGVLPRLRSVGR